MVCFSTSLGQSKEAPYFVIHLRVNVKQDSSMDSKKSYILSSQTPLHLHHFTFSQKWNCGDNTFQQNFPIFFWFLQFQLCYDIKHFLNVLISFGGDDSSKLHSLESKSLSTQNWIWKLNEFAFCFLNFVCITSFTIILQLYIHNAFCFINPCLHLILWIGWKINQLKTFTRYPKKKN
jgi:hypothetical protein